VANIHECYCYISSSILLDLLLGVFALELVSLEEMFLQYEPDLLIRQVCPAYLTQQSLEPVLRNLVPLVSQVQLDILHLRESILLDMEIMNEFILDIAFDSFRGLHAP